MILNVGNSMETKLENSTSTRIEFAKESIQHLLRQKVLFNAKDHFGIILLGTDTSQNSNRDNISVIRSLSPAEIETFDLLKKIKTHDGNKGDCKSN